MRPGITVGILTILSLAGLPFQNQALAQELKGPIIDLQGQGTTPLPEKGEAGSMAGLGTAPGSGTTMTQDMLLVSPTASQTGTPQPLTAYIGMTLKIDVDRKEVLFKDLRGLAITVLNDTNRALIVDGENATARIGNRALKCASLTALQLAVLPEHGVSKVPIDLLTIVAPAGATAGAWPTVEDLYKFSRPPLMRYGRDQQRRLVEATRFGKRILWPHEKTQGIVYFQTKEPIAGASVEIPVNTLFDKNDTGTLICAPAPAENKPAGQSR
jgi:hypothetical protein